MRVVKAFQSDVTSAGNVSSPSAMTLQSAMLAAAMARGGGRGGLGGAQGPNGVVFAKPNEAKRVFSALHRPEALQKQDSIVDTIAEMPMIDDTLEGDASDQQRRREAAHLAKSKLQQQQNHPGKLAQPIMLTISE